VLACVPKIVVRLHREPGARRACACLFQPQRQIGANRRLAVQHPRKRDPRHGEPTGGLGNGQVERDDNFIAEQFAGWGGLCIIGMASMVILTIDEFGVCTNKAERAAPLTIDPNRPRHPILISLRTGEGDCQRGGGDASGANRKLSTTPMRSSLAS
jgi:hypothetical protein